MKMMKNIQANLWLTLVIAVLLFLSCEEEELHVKVPIKVKGLTARIISATAIELTWKDSSDNEDGFRVYRSSVDSFQNMTPIGTVGANQTIYTDSGLTPSTLYLYRVIAFNAGGDGIGSSIITARTAKRPDLPVPSHVKTLALSSTSIQLTWVDNSVDEDGYKIERTRTDSLSALRQIASLPSNAQTFTDTGLEPYTSFIYRVYSYNSHGQSQAVLVYGASIPSTGGSPSEPLMLRAVAFSDTKLFLSWQDNSINESGFRIERAPGTLGDFVQIDTVHLNSDNYEDSPVIAGTIYRYRVRAFNSIGNSPYSNVVYITAGIANNPPFPPANLFATVASATQINLVWEDHAITETGFRVERAPGGTTAFALIASLPKSATSYQNAGVTPATQYIYRVKAYNNYGSSNYTNIATATTFSTSAIPAAPRNLAGLALSPTKVQLLWADSSNNEDGFKIEQALGNTTNFFPLLTVGPNTTKYLITGLANGTMYSFRIRAYNLVGNSGYSNIITRTTTTAKAIPIAPSRLKRQEVGSDYVTLTWKDNSAEEEGFYVERAPGPTQPFVQIASLPINTLGYTDHEVLSDSIYTYRVRAYNQKGASGYSNGVTANTSKPTETRFINGSSRAIIYLNIDGTQYLTSSPQGIQSESFLPVELPVGRHYYGLRTGTWSDQGERVMLYSDTGSFIQETGKVNTVIFSDPSIFSILTKFSNSGYWEGGYQDTTGAQILVGFRFFTDGTYFLSQNGNFRRTGVFRLVRFNQDLTLVFSNGEFEAVLSEVNDTFTMPNGPSYNRVITYYYLAP